MNTYKIQASRFYDVDSIMAAARVLGVKTDRLPDGVLMRPDSMRQELSCIGIARAHGVHDDLVLVEKAK